MKFCLFIYRLILWIVALPVHLFMCGLCWVLSPILPLFAIGKGRLPKYLSWFQTPDAPLDGDSGFEKVFPPEKWPKYLRRVFWLWRNPAYGFAWSVLSYQPKGPEYNWYGSIKLCEEVTGDGFGWYFLLLPSGVFQFSFRKPFLFGKQLRFRFGWKLVGLATHGNWETRKKYVFTFNPFDGG